MEETVNIKTNVFGAKKIVKRFDLVTPGLWVDLFMNPKAGELNLPESGPLYTAFIEAWNVGDEAGQLLPVSSENAVKNLSIQDVAVISKALRLDAIFSPAKKNS